MAVEDHLIREDSVFIRFKKLVTSLYYPMTRKAERFLEFYDYDASAQDHMVSDMEEMFPSYTRWEIETFFSIVLSTPDYLDSVIVDVQHLRSRQSFDLHQFVSKSEDKDIEYEEIDDEIDGIQKVEKIVQKLFYKHFPYVTVSYVTARVNVILRYCEKMRNVRIEELKNKDNNKFIQLDYHARLCVELYDFDKIHLPFMHQDFFDLNEKRGVNVRRGLCYQMIENCLTNPEHIKAGITKREFNVVKTKMINNETIEEKIKTIFQELDQTITTQVPRIHTVRPLTEISLDDVAKSFFLHFDVASGKYDYAEEYSFEEIQHRMKEFFGRSILYEPVDFQNRILIRNEDDVIEISDGDSTL